MSKIPTLKAHDVIKALRKAGFVEHRRRSTSHLILKHPDGRRVCIPVHKGKDIRRGTLSGILTDADLDRDDFLKLLR